MLLLKNETASLRLDIVNYEFSEVEYGMDEYDRNWLLLRCTWTEDVTSTPMYVCWHRRSRSLPPD